MARHGPRCSGVTKASRQVAAILRDRGRPAPAQPVPGGGDDRLSQADPPVVARDARVGQDAEPARLQRAGRPAQAAAGSGRRRRTTPPCPGRAARAGAGSPPSTIAATPLWKRPAMTSRGTPPARSSAAARTKSAPRTRKRRRRLDGRGVGAAFARIGELLELDRGLALVVDRVPDAEERGHGVEEPARARGQRGVDAVPAMLTHRRPALRRCAARRRGRQRRPRTEDRRRQVSRRHPPRLPDGGLAARQRHRRQVAARG